MNTTYKKFSEYSKEEQKELITKAKNGNQQALIDIWKGVYGAIKSEAIKYQNNSGSLEVDDLVQSFFKEFWNGVNTYEFDMNTNFLTYIINISKRRMSRIIQETGSIIKVPVHTAHKSYKIKKLCNNEDIEKTFSNAGIIAEKTGLSKSEVEAVLEIESSRAFTTDEIEYVAQETTFGEDYSNEALETIDRLQQVLTMAEFTLLRHYLGIGTPQLTKGIILERYDITRTAFDNLIAKAKRLGNKENYEN